MENHVGNSIGTLRDPQRHRPASSGAAAEQRRHGAAVQIQPVRLGQVGDRRQGEHAPRPGRGSRAYQSAS